MNNITGTYSPTSYILDRMTYTDSTVISNVYTPSLTYIPPTITDTYMSVDTYNTYGNLSIEGDIVLGGEKLSDVFAEIRDALHLLKRDRQREEKYAELNAIAEEYTKTLNRIRAMEVVAGEDNIK